MTYIPENRHYALIDDYLGPGDSRFFSAGYRRARHHLHDIRVTPAVGKDPCVTARVSIEYPRD